MIIASILLIIGIVVDIIVKSTIKTNSKTSIRKGHIFILKLDEFLIGLMSASVITLIIVAIMYPLTAFIQYLVNLW